MGVSNGNGLLAKATTKVIHEMPRECLHSAAMRKMEKRLAAAEAENERLQGFVILLAERIFKAHEVLGNLAEKRKR